LLTTGDGHHSGVRRQCRFGIAGYVNIFRRGVVKLLSNFRFLLEKFKQYKLEFHYLFIIRSSGSFDRSWYLAQNPDVAQAKVNPLLHYLRFGGFEGRDPSPNFCSAFYLDMYTDVKSARINPLAHYLRYGRKEGRKIQPVRKNNSVEDGKVSSAYISRFGDQAERYFCVSMQRTGTTSIGKFFRDFGFQWAGWPHSERNNWYELAYEGDFENIFSSVDFRSANAFEDSPWFFPDFYKMLFHRFPNSKFILLTRDPDAWFQSMLKHSRGNIIGKARIHCKVYRRELEYFDLLRSGAIDEEVENQLFSEKKMKIIGHAEHYKSIYLRHNIEVQDFFRRHAPEALYVGSLEDPEKWNKLGRFLNIEVPVNYESHENKSKYK
jgi:hypothetical protein